MLPVTSSYTDMMSLIAILDCGVKLIVEVVGLPLILVDVVLDAVRAVSSTVLVRVTSVEVDCSIINPSLE